MATNAGYLRDVTRQTASLLPAVFLLAPLASLRALSLLLSQGFHQVTWDDATVGPKSTCVPRFCADVILDKLKAAGGCMKATRITRQRVLLDLSSATLQGLTFQDTRLTS